MMVCPIYIPLDIFFFICAIYAIANFSFILPYLYPCLYFIVPIVTVLAVYCVRDCIRFQGWEKIGKIKYTYSDFIDKEVKRKFVVYTTDANNPNVVVQYISASIKAEVLLECIGENSPTVEVINPDGSKTNVYFCGELLSSHLAYMVHYVLKLSILSPIYLGIVPEERDKVNPDEPIKTSYLLVDVDDSCKTRINKTIADYEGKYIFGQSDEKKISVKINNTNYSDVSIFMNILDDCIEQRYVNYVAFGILGNNKLVDDKKISPGDDVYLKMSDR